MNSISVWLVALALLIFLAASPALRGIMQPERPGGGSSALAAQDSEANPPEIAATADKAGTFGAAIGLSAASSHNGSLDEAEDRVRRQTPTTAQEIPLVREVKEKPPGMRLTAEERREIIAASHAQQDTIFDSLAEAEERLGHAITVPGALPANTRLAQVQQSPDTGSFTFVYARTLPPHGALMIRTGIVIHASGVAMKEGYSREVTLNGGGRAVLIQGGWDGDKWREDGMVSAVAEDSNRRHYLIYAAPENAWTMDDLMVILDSLD